MTTGSSAAASASPSEYQHLLQASCIQFSPWILVWLISQGPQLSGAAKKNYKLAAYLGCCCRNGYGQGMAHSSNLRTLEGEAEDQEFVAF